LKKKEHTHKGAQVKTQDLSHVKDTIILKLTLVKRENQTNQTIASQSPKKEN